MSWTYGFLFIPILISCFILWYFLDRRENSIHSWVKLYWDKRPSLSKKVADFLFVIGMGILLFTLLDLRGPQKKTNYSTQEQKTVILIDTSASMLVEDVRPNRFQKAIFMARHFVKKAIGHQISIIAFSDKSKRIIPFTSDTDLLDARLSSLKSLNLTSGGTSLITSLSESIQYLSDEKGNFDGNILIFTDAENTSEANVKKVSKNVRVGLVGIGTQKGGFIPIRNHKGDFVRYLTHKGKKVTSKLEAKNLEKIGEDIHYFKFWEATSYSLDTESILNYFSKAKRESDREKERIVKPAIGNKILLIGIILFIISYLLRWNPAFVCLIFLLPSLGIKAQGQEQEKPEKNERTLFLEDSLMKGKSSQLDRLKLAEEYLRIEEFEKSENLYRENLNTEIEESKKEYYMNWAITKAQLGQTEEAFNLLDKLESLAEEDSVFFKMIKKNKIAMTRIKPPKPQNKNSGDKNNQQKNKDQEGDQEERKSGEGNPENGNNQQQSNSQNGEEQKDKQKKEQYDNLSEQEKKVKQRKAQAMLGQLKDKDRELQNKYIDKETRSRKFKRDKKQW